MLHIVGSNRDIVLITQTGSNIMVMASFNSSNPVSFARRPSTRFRFAPAANSDIVLTTPNVTKTMTIDGGSGNDLLTGGGGRNVIIGGTGHECSTAAAATTCCSAATATTTSSAAAATTCSSAATATTFSTAARAATC